MYDIRNILCLYLVFAVYITRKPFCIEITIIYLRKYLLS